MKSVFYILVVVVAVSFLAGCSREDDAIQATLDNAERLMEDAPDSALAMMESIDPASLKTDRGHALHALLLARARYKNYIDETDDSLINIAVNYYKGNGGYCEMLSLFQQACIYYNRAEYPKAIVVATHSNELADELNDDLWRARNEDLIARIFGKSHNSIESLVHKKIAYDYYVRANRNSDAKYTAIEIALDYNSLDSVEKSLETFKSIDLGGCDSTFMGYYFNMGSYIMYRNELYDEADGMLKQLTQYRKYYNPTSTDYADYSLLKVGFNNIDAAKLYCDSAFITSKNESDSLSAKVAELSILKSLSKYAEALLLEDEIVNMQAKIVRETIRESAMSAQRDLYSLLETESNREAERSRLIAIVAVLVLILFIIAGVVFVKMKLKLKASEIENKINEISRLSRELESNRLVTASLSQESSERQLQFHGLVEKLLRKRFETINRFCDEYFDASDDKGFRNKIYGKVEKEIREFCGQENVSELESIINGSYDGILDRIRMQIPYLTDENVMLLTLIYSGFSPRAICVFFDIKIKAFYSRRERLVKRIMESDADDKEEFVRLVR